MTIVQVAQRLRLSKQQVSLWGTQGAPVHDIDALQDWLEARGSTSRALAGRNGGSRQIELAGMPSRLPAAGEGIQAASDDEAKEIAEDFARDRELPVAAWCSKHLTLTEADTDEAGPLVSRPYFREPMQTAAEVGVRQVAICAGVQVGKTTSIMGIVAWAIANDPGAMLWVMPSTTLGRSFSRTRWRPLLERSDRLQRLIPPADTHAITNMDQRFSSCYLNFVGSNSPAALASRPVRWLVCDETDKFAQATAREASAIELAKMRTRKFAFPKVYLTSTPTIEEAEIWQHYLEGDRRTYRIMCPHCFHHIKLVWSQVKFGEAKREDGSWDKEKVLKIARYECQECAHAISDAEKVKALPYGYWRAENENPVPGCKSYHLNSLYSPDAQCAWGELALKWVSGMESLTGLQGFVNSVLAEPWENQTVDQERLELVTDAPAAKGEGTPIMTVDVQAAAPFFWYVVRVWESGQSRATAAGSLASWDEVRDTQTAHGVQDRHVLVDCGYNESGVIENCLKWGKPLQRPGRPALWAGWMPMRGVPGTRSFRDPKTGLMRPFRKVPKDPFMGKHTRGKARRQPLEMWVLESSVSVLKDMLERLRRGSGLRKWEVSKDVATDEYWQHMDGEIRRTRINRRTNQPVWEWVKRSAKWPNHLLDCEVMQISGAMFYRLFDPGNETNAKDRPAAPAVESQPNEGENTDEPKIAEPQGVG